MGWVDARFPASKLWNEHVAEYYIDTLYPSLRDSTTGNFLEWNVVCQIHNTGCGRTVYGNSKKNAIERWNAGKIDENLG